MQERGKGGPVDRNNEELQNALAEFERERHYNQKLWHINIVSMLGICDVPNVGPHLLMEHCSLRNLKEYLIVRAASKKLKPCMRLGFAVQVASGLTYLHSENIAHCDLAARNVMLHEMEGGDIIAKVC